MTRPFQENKISSRIFVIMLNLYGTREDTKIWAKIISRVRKSAVGWKFRRSVEVDGGKKGTLNRPLGASTHNRAITRMGGV